MDNTKKCISIWLILFILFGDIYFFYYYSQNSTSIFIVFFLDSCLFQCIYKALTYRTSLHSSVELPLQPSYNPIVCIEITNNKKDNNYEQCSICLDETSEGLVELTCNHIFHRECIEKWNKVQNFCPNCRNDMSISNENIHV